MILFIADPSQRAEAVSDPLSFIERNRATFNAEGYRHLRALHRLPIAGGSEWGLLLPGDGDVATLRTTFGDLLADQLERARAHEPELPIAWKVVECVATGGDGGAMPWLHRGGGT